MSYSAITPSAPAFVHCWQSMQDAYLLSPIQAFSTRQGGNMRQCSVMFVQWCILASVCLNSFKWWIWCLFGATQIWTIATSSCPCQVVHCCHVLRSVK